MSKLTEEFEESSSGSAPVLQLACSMFLTFNNGLAGGGFDAVASCPDPSSSITTCCRFCRLPPACWPPRLASLRPAGLSSRSSFSARAHSSFAGCRIQQIAVCSQSREMDFFQNIRVHTNTRRELRGRNTNLLGSNMRFGALDELQAATSFDSTVCGSALTVPRNPRGTRVV